MTLPQGDKLPVHLLAACFNNTVASYKFYWFLTILSRVENGETTIAKHHLFADMIAQCWYTVNYFRLSLGKQDKLQSAVEKIRKLEKLTIDANQNAVFEKLIHSKHKQTQQALWYFNAEVPHRFLSPWFKAADTKLAYQKSQNFTGECLYALDGENIHINPNWTNYLRDNVGVLKAFCYWNLSLYLQSRNPNVPDIPNKLIKNPLRKSLTQQRRLFWDIVIAELGGVDCIYTNSRLQVDAYAVEHFLPYAFVSHDLIWNLIPANPAFNSYKSDRLPRLEDYFDKYHQLHQQALEIITVKTPKNKFLQDYLTILPGFEPERLTKTILMEQIQPLITIASNNGFEYLEPRLIIESRAS